MYVDLHNQALCLFLGCQCGSFRRLTGGEHPVFLYSWADADGYSNVLYAVHPKCSIWRSRRKSAAIYANLDSDCGGREPNRCLKPGSQSREPTTTTGRHIFWHPLHPSSIVLIVVCKYHRHAPASCSYFLRHFNDIPAVPTQKTENLDPVLHPKRKRLVCTVL